MYNPIQSGKVFEQIVIQIEQSILSGKLRSGDRLPTERELGEQFRASRTAVREAMKTLAQKGLVEMRPGRGTVIIDATSQAMQQSLDLLMRVNGSNTSQDLVEIREILEPEIAIRAAMRATEEDIAALQEAVRTMDQSLENADVYIAADNDFHRILARGTQNALILMLVDSIVNLLGEQRKHIFSVAGGPQRGQVYHKEIIAAIMLHDSEQAHASMRAHLQQVREDVMRSQTA